MDLMSKMVKLFTIRAIVGNVSEGSSATRFGEILILWQTFTSLWQFFDGVLLIWQNVESSLANMLLHYWANFHCCKCSNFEKQSGHSGR